MDNFIVSARKYRPATFHSVVGQQHITNTLKNAIKNNQLAQAFLFCGPRGVGKTTCARILAKAINCHSLTADFEACGSCDSCNSFQNGNSFSIHELDAASNNSVDDIRSLIEQVRIPPQTGKYKIYIIDEVHMLSQSAFNAFLKTLEEPPSYAIFILATTEKHKILPTILSRCQIFDFNRIKVNDIADHLEDIAQREGVHCDRDGLHLISQKADGGLRDALSMFDQIVSFSNKNVTYKAVIDNLNILDYDYYFKVTDALLAEDIAITLLTFDEILTNGFDGNHFIIGLASHFRNLLVCKDEVTLKLLEVSEGIRQKYQQQSQHTSVSFLLSALSISNQCDLNYRTSKNQRLQVELSLIKMCHISAAFNLSVSKPISLENLGEATLESPKKTNNNEKKNAKPFVNSASTIPEKDKSTTVSEAVKVNLPQQTTADTDSNDGKYLSEAVLLKPIEIITEEQVPIISKPFNLKAGAVATLIPNLNDLSFNASKLEELKPDYISGSSQQNFGIDMLKKCWNTYADKKKEEGKINLFTLMTSNPPLLLDNFIIEVGIENKIQENQLADEKIDLLNFLRVELQNFSIDIATKLIEQPQKKRLYTSTEKFQHMVEKNPKLEEFRQKFNLSIEY